MNTNAPGHVDGVGDWAEVVAKWSKLLLAKLPRQLRGHVVAGLGELLGTILFLFIAFSGTQVARIASNPNTGTTIITTTDQNTPQELLYIALSFGFALTVNAWVFFRVSGGLFNPAVTVGMWLIGSITIGRCVLLFAVQCVGAIIAAALTETLFTGALNVGTSMSTTTRVAQGVIIEMILTAQLVFTIFMLAAEKHTGNFIAPVGIGLSLFVGELVGVYWTGGSMNPARSLGPAVVTKEFNGDHWVYWVGPLAGSVLAVIVFKLIKALEYETADSIPTGEEAADAAALAPTGSIVLPPSGAPTKGSQSPAKGPRSIGSNGTAGTLHDEEKDHRDLRRVQSVSTASESGVVRQDYGNSDMV